METRRLAIGLLALTVLGCVNADGFFRTGFETVYRYFGDVRAASYLPAEFASQFGIKADLKVQNIDGSKAIFQFSDVHYQVSTGELAYQEFSKAKFLPAPTESDSLKLPFEVIYEGGKVKSVLTVDEPEWSQNIKKAVAAIFQLDMPHLHYDKPNAFVTEEKTLYGMCAVGYTVQPKEKGFVDVMKVQEYGKCKNFPMRYYTNGVYEDCPFDHHDDSLLLGSTRHYKLFTDHGKVQVKDIFSKSIAAAVPFNGKSDDQTVLVRQNFTFVSEKPITEEMHFTPLHEVKELTYVVPHFYNEVGSFSDLTGGRDHKVMEEVMEKMHKTLGEFVDYMEEIKVVKEPGKLNNKLSQQLTFLLGQLDVECLTHCFEKYMKPKTYREENLRGAFLETTAQVGSKASVLFIRNLILSHKVPDVLAAELLRLIPFYVREPSLALVKEFETLLNVDMEDKVKKTAVLSVANLVSLTYKKIHDVEMLNHYADMFYKSFKVATKYGLKLNYLSALVNLKEEKVLDYLTEIVHDKHYPNHLRYVALWGTYEGGKTLPVKMYELYWPIFSDYHETLEMRAAAMKLILETKSTFHRFLSVFWFMQSEPSSQLYYYFYTGLESISKTHHPCHMKLGHHAERFLRYAKIPATTYVFTGDYFMDFMDREHSIGGDSHVSYIGDPDTGAPNIFYYSQGGYYSGHDNEYFAVLVKLSGVTEYVKTQLLKVDREVVKMGDLMKILSSLHIKPVHLEPFQVEVVFYTNHRVVETYYYDESNFKKLVEDIKGIGSSLQRDYKLRQHNLIYTAVHEYVQPTDIGMPVVWNLALPYAYSIVGNFTHDTTGPRVTRKNDVEIRYGRHGGHSLSFYNPIAGMWHGAYRMMSHVYTIPIHNHLSLDFTQKHFKFAMARDEKHDMNLGLAYHVRTQVFATDHKTDHVLHESCPTCAPYVTVHTPGVEKREFNVFHYDSEHTGAEYNVDVFDCDQYHASHEIVSLIKEVFDEEDINVDSQDVFGPWYIQMRKMHTFLALSPNAGSCGVTFTVSPSKVHPLTQLEGVVRVLTEDVPESKMVTVFPGSKYTVRGSVTLKGDEHVYHTVDLNGFMENSHDHVNQHFNFKLTHTAPKEKGYKICMDVENKYPEVPSDKFVQRKPHEEEVTSKITMMWGEPVDGKCPTDGSGFKVKMTATPVHEEDYLTKYPYVQCAKDAKKPEWQGVPYMPVTEACFRAALDSTHLNKFTGYARYYNIPEEFFEVGNTIVENLEEEYGLHETSETVHTINVDVPSAVDQHHGKGKSGLLKYLFEFEKTRPILDMHFGWEGEDEEQHYTMKYDTETPELDSSRFFFLRRLAYETGFLSTCVVTPSSVLTLDNDTYHYHSSHCFTLLTADCSDHPKYAVFTKKVEGPYDLAVKFYTGGNYLEIVPDLQGHFEVNINGHAVAGGLQNGYQYPENEQLYDFKLWHKDGFVTLFSKLSQVMVEYTGHSVSVTLPAMYRGYSCGLCGDFDSDSVLSEREEVVTDCPFGDAVGNYLGYRYTMLSDKCPEITEKMTKHVECEHH